MRIPQCLLTGNVLVWERGGEDTFLFLEKKVRLLVEISVETGLLLLIS